MNTIGMAECQRRIRIDPARVFVADRPEPIPLPPHLVALKHGKPRVHGPPIQGVLVFLGLSPWSLYPRCDICSHVPPYMRRVGLTAADPVIAYGRFAAHRWCYEANHELETMQLPALDYRALSQVHPITGQPKSAWMLLSEMRARLRVQGEGENEAEEGASRHRADVTLSTRQGRLFQRLKVQTLAEFTQFRREQLLRIGGVGLATVSELEALMQARGLKFQEGPRTNGD